MALQDGEGGRVMERERAGLDGAVETNFNWSRRKKIIHNILHFILCIIHQHHTTRKGYVVVSLVTSQSEMNDLIIN